MRTPTICHILIAMGLVCLITILGAAENTSALMLEMGVEELATGADAIIAGQVLNRKSHWNRSGTEILTRVDISVQERLKGSPISARIAITVPGGRIGNTTVEVTDVPDFIVGEKVLIFIRLVTEKQAAADGLVRTGDNTPWFRIHGGFQGKFSIFNDKIGNLPFIKFKERIVKALAGEIPAYPESPNSLNPEPVPPVQTITGITPSSAAAGTNTWITISGENLGASTGTPYFYYKNNEYYGCPSCVSSWSDSDVVVKVPVFKASNGYDASAGSGPVYLVTPAGNQSNAFPFTVTFSYGGIKWAGISPVVEFTVNPNGDSGVLKAVQDAADSWNAVAGKNFSFKYAGITPAVKTAGNQINEIIWADLQAGMIGQASMRSYGGILGECDITLNTQYKWSTVVPTPKDAMDVQTVALHELGHWLYLRDLYGNVSGYPTDMDKIMYGFGGYGIQKRSPTPHDSQGMRYIYPGANPCAASLSLMTDATFHLHVPVVDTDPVLWIDFLYEPALSSSPMFRLVHSGDPASPSDFADCLISNLSLVNGNYILHIPELIYNGVSYRAELTYFPTTDGWIWFIPSGAWAN